MAIEMNPLILDPVPLGRRLNAIREAWIKDFCREMYDSDKELVVPGPQAEHLLAAIQIFFVERELRDRAGNFSGFNRALERMVGGGLETRVMLRRIREAAPPDEYLDQDSLDRVLEWLEDSFEHTLSACRVRAPLREAFAVLYIQTIREAR